MSGSTRSRTPVSGDSRGSKSGSKGSSNENGSNSKGKAEAAASGAGEFKDDSVKWRPGCGYFVQKEAHAHAVRTYHYVGKDLSAIADHMYPYWKWVHRTFIPDDWSPNVVTVCGLAAALTAFAISVTAFPRLISLSTDDDPSLDPNQATDPWTRSIIAFTISFLLFFYQTMDAVDGLQGRKTGMYQNCTTEIFDHAVDSIVSVLMMVCGASLLSVGVSWVVCAFFLGISITFTSATWEHLHTGIMTFQPGLTNPTESLCLMVLMFAVCGMCPATMWTCDLLTKLPSPIATPLRWLFSLLPESARLSLTPTNVLVLTIVVSAIHNLVASMRKVFSPDNTFSNIAKEERHTNTIRNERIKGLVPIAVIVVAATTVALSFSLSPNGVLASSPICSLLCVALSWNLYIVHLISAEITHHPFRLLLLSACQSHLILLIVVALFGHMSFMKDIWVVKYTPEFCLSIAIMTYGWTVFHLVRECCDAIGMRHWYTVPPNNKQDDQGQTDTTSSSSSTVKSPSKAQSQPKSHL